MNHVKIKLIDFDKFFVVVVFFLLFDNLQIRAITDPESLPIIYKTLPHTVYLPRIPL